MISGWRRRLREDESGISLVEMLVTISLLVVVSVPFTRAMVLGMQTQRRQVSTIHATTEIQIAMEQVTRDLRGANPLLAPLDPSAVRFTVYRTGGLRPAAYVVQTVGGTSNLVLQETVGPTTTDRLVLKDLQPLPAGQVMFTYLDASGAVMAPSDPPEDVARIVIRLRAAVMEQPDATLVDSVALRNKET